MGCDLPAEKKTESYEVKERTKDAATAGEETMFLPSNGDGLIGYAAPGIYRV